MSLSYVGLITFTIFAMYMSKRLEAFSVLLFIEPEFVICATKDNRLYCRVKNKKEYRYEQKNA